MREMRRKINEVVARRAFSDVEGPRRWMSSSRAACVDLSCCPLHPTDMVTRQRRSRVNRGSGNVGSRGGLAASPGDRSSRLKWLLAVLALTTTLLIALQLYRKGGIATRAALSSRRSSQERRATSKGSWAGGSRSSGSGGDESLLQLEEMRRKWSALGKVLKEEVDNLPASGKGEGGAGMGAPAIVPGEGVQDHPVKGSEGAAAPPHVPGKSEEQAEEDRRIGLEDLDQDTLKAMMDLLYARE